MMTILGGKPATSDVIDLLLTLADLALDAELLGFMVAHESDQRDIGRLQRWFASLVERIETADLCQRTIGLSNKRAADLDHEVKAYGRVIDALKRQCRRPAA